MSDMTGTWSCTGTKRGRITDADLREIEADLEHRGRRSQRILIGLLCVAALLYVLGWQTAGAATLNSVCTPPTKNTDGSTITATMTYTAYWGTSATTLTHAAPVAGPGCNSVLSVPDAPIGASVTYFVAHTATAAGVESAKSNVLSKTVSTAAVPTTSLLLTVGGAVLVAMPNYTNFGWKTGSAVGTIAPRIKCDPTRHIPPDLWRVTAPIVWTAPKKDYVVARCVAQ